MKNFLIILIVFFSFQTFSQTKLEIVEKQLDSTTVVNNGYNLLIIMNNECGHCLIALRELQSMKNIGIIAVDYGPDNMRLELQKQYSYTFLDGKKIKSFGSQDFFPKLFLFKNNDLIWKKEGWFQKNLEKIQSKIER